MTIKPQSHEYKIVCEHIKTHNGARSNF